MLLLLIGSCTAYDYGSRYASWMGLDKAGVVAAAQWYVRERAPGQKVCLYVATCAKGRARLALVKDMAAWDVEATRQLAWDRRFSDACPGYTANLALEVAQGGPQSPPLGTERAVWSFYLDRFRPWQTHDFSAFSEKPTEPCTPEHAIAG
ncbi:hypothetical protein [Erythrobacter sp. BLCC-B19]|uniref:hypothetical protein n=1 Tax=Erythrobacter sp. BLCC-B19 TaxID=3025315 RepID=UPI002361A3CE|nr:hypothetical protein [Erythrobacter sp. BLCC-B19]WDA42439.1 hypothetical protein PS060_06415 [Erythrobacter sp. BLCC-B19]